MALWPTGTSKCGRSERSWQDNSSREVKKLRRSATASDVADWIRKTAGIWADIDGEVF